MPVVYVVYAGMAVHSRRHCWRTLVTLGHGTPLFHQHGRGMSESCHCLADMWPCPSVTYTGALHIKHAYSFSTIHSPLSNPVFSDTCCGRV
jgi:hypothetical protein